MPTRGCSKVVMAEECNKMAFICMPELTKTTFVEEQSMTDGLC